jgi:DNA-binding winged helix-turn-helix (wHTH) protein/predicted negative regulator of RcsB-dependent stress response
MQPLDGPDGEVGLAIQLRPDLVDHPVIQKGLDGVLAFMREPGVPGLLPLVADHREKGLFIYAISSTSGGQGRLLSDVLARCASRGVVPGERAAVELLRRVSAVLDAAARADGPVDNHGALSPSRIVVYPDGDVALLGYALPPVEVVAWLDEHTDELPGAGLLYSPPERIQDDNEDVRSDLYSLGAIAAELATGSPPLVGTPQELVDKILRGKAATQLDAIGRDGKDGKDTARPVRGLLRRMLARSPADRPRTGAEVSSEARMLLRSVGGRTLGGISRGAFDEIVAATPEPAQPEATPKPAVRQPEQVPEPEGEATPKSTDGTITLVALPFGLGEVRYVPRRMRLPIRVPRFASRDGVVADAQEAPLPVEKPAAKPLLPERAPEPVPEPVPEKVELAELAELTPTEPASPTEPDDLEQPSKNSVEPVEEAVEKLVEKLTEKRVRKSTKPPRSTPKKKPSKPKKAREPATGPVVTEESWDWVVSTEDASDPPTTDEEELYPVRDDDTDAAEADRPVDDARPAHVIRGMGIPAPVLPPEILEEPPTDEVPFDGPARTVYFDPAPTPFPATPSAPQPPDLLYLKTVTVDLPGHQILVENGEPVRLSDIQVAVLGYMAARPGRSISKEELWLEALGQHGSLDSVRGIITRLRKKIERDPAEPDHLVNVAGVGYRFVPSEIEAAGPDPLPEPPGPLYGRDAEIEEVRQALVTSRLVTVAGPPGSGAEWVALLAARAVAEEGVSVYHCMVDGVERVASMLARGLGIRRIGRKTPDVLADIGALLASRDDVLVFLDSPTPDAGLREMVWSWLGQAQVLAPRGSEGPAKVLMACGGALDLPGERCIRLKSLREDEAIELFRQRVAEVRGAEVTEELATAIADHLDRMPIALEAAAARTAFLAPDALLERLDRGQEWGEAGLDANVAATIDRLDPTERAALQQCVVFRDGFDLGAAESIVGLPDSGRAMINVIESLVDRSLLRVASDGETANVRWTLYETVRSYVRRTMESELLEWAQKRHSECYGQFGLRLGGRPWVERPELTVLVREKENLRGALQQGGPAAAGAALGLTAILGHEAAAPLAEAIERILANPALAEPQNITWLSAARVASARVHLYLGQPQKARTELRAVQGPGQGSNLDMQLLAEVARLHTDLGSTTEAELAMHRVSTGDPWLLAVLAVLRGRTLAAKGQAKKAERPFVEALHGFGSLEAEIGMAHAQRHYAEILASAGQGRRATALLEQATTTFEGVGDTLDAVQCRMRLAEMLVGIGAGQEATAHLENVMESARAAQAHSLLALARGVLGVVRTLSHEWDEAERLFYLALGGSAPEHKRIQSLFALHKLLHGDPETALEEARSAQPDPVAMALVAVLERQPAPHTDDEAFLVWEALEQWRAAASMARIESQLAKRASVAVRMVLACPRERPRRTA